MKLELSDEKEYSMEVIADGTFYDEGFNIRTITVRLSPAALNDYLWNRYHNDLDCFENEEDWREDCKAKDENLKEWWRRIRKMFGWEKDTGAINQIVSEIFTAVFMEKV